MFVLDHFTVSKLLLDKCSCCFKIPVPTDFHLVLKILCKESDFEIETEIVSLCFQSVTIYSRTSVARTLMACLP